SGGKSSSSSSNSKWVFYYYGANGSRSCGNLCIVTVVFVIISIISVIGCGILRCYGIRRRSRAELAELENNRIDFGEHKSNYYGYNNKTYYNNNSRPPSAYASTSVIPITFPAPIHDAPYNKLKPSRSFDSMDEIIQKKKY
ncbi:895_t:CDS:1, partial [Funneliformis geosporum]